MPAIVISLKPSLAVRLRRWLTERNLFRQIRAAEFELAHLKADLAQLPKTIEAREKHLAGLANAVQRNRYFG